MTGSVGQMVHATPRAGIECVAYTFYSGKVDKSGHSYRVVEQSEGV
jgi:hypothetical protein